MRERLWAVACTLGVLTIHYVGDLDAHVKALLVLMGIDYLSGLLLPFVFGKSKKSRLGKFHSRESIKGLFKKGMMIGLIVVAKELDIVIGGEFVADAVIIAFIVNESLSITEHAALAGVPIPEKLRRAIGALHEKTDDKPEAGNSKNA